MLVEGNPCVVTNLSGRHDIQTKGHVVSTFRLAFLAARTQWAEARDFFEEAIVGKANHPCKKRAKARAGVRECGVSVAVKALGKSVEAKALDMLVEAKPLCRNWETVHEMPIPERRDSGLAQCS